jgi:hypothetical protein
VGTCKTLIQRIDQQIFLVDPSDQHLNQLVGSIRRLTLEIGRLDSVLVPKYGEQIGQKETYSSDISWANERSQDVALRQMTSLGPINA